MPTSKRPTTKPAPTKRRPQRTRLVDRGRVYDDAVDCGQFVVPDGADQAQRFAYRRAYVNSTTWNTSTFPLRPTASRESKEQLEVDVFFRRHGVEFKNLTARGFVSIDSLDADSTRADGAGTLSASGATGRTRQVVKTWQFQVHRRGEDASRAREWLFMGPEAEVNATKRSLLLVNLYMARWLRSIRPKASQRTIARDVLIAEWLTAESSPWLAYRGRALSPHYPERERDYKSTFGQALIRHANRQRELRERVRAREESGERPAEYGSEDAEVSRFDDVVGRRLRGARVKAAAAAFNVTPAVARRISRDVDRFSRSTLYRERGTAYDAVDGRVANL